MRAEVSGQMAQALRYPHTAVIHVEAWRGGTRVDTQLAQGLQVLGGEVKNDGTAKVRRTGTVELPATDSVWKLLEVPGTELRPYRGIVWPDGTQTLVPLGRLEVTEGRIGYAPNGNLSVTGQDAYAKIQASEFLAPGVATFGTLITSTMVSFIQGALPGVPVLNQIASTYYIGDKVYVQDRAAAIEEMATALAGEVIVDAVGQIVIRPLPQIATTAVWSVDASSSGVLLSADRAATNANIRNVVMVIATAVDGTALFDPVYVWDNVSTSPTYAGPDPVNNPGAAGPFGVRVYRLTSSAMSDPQQAHDAAAARLGLVSGQQSSLTVTAAVNPGLEYGDTISVLLPPDPVTGVRVIEAHLIETVTVPLTVDGAQQITTRSRGGLTS